jgi:hypothetical protein
MMAAKLRLESVFAYGVANAEAFALRTILLALGEV